MIAEQTSSWIPDMSKGDVVYKVDFNFVNLQVFVIEELLSYEVFASFYCEFVDVSYSQTQFINANLSNKNYYENILWILFQFGVLSILDVLIHYGHVI